MKAGPLAVAVMTALAFATSVHASEHTGYWNGPTPTGQAFECEGAATRARMVEVLRQAGWDMDAGIPKIDWRRDKAVIVAPRQYYKAGELRFYGMRREGGAIVLNYGWKRIVSRRSEPGTVTLGSSREGHRATIVVSYRQQLDRGLRFLCRNWGLRN